MTLLMDAPTEPVYVKIQREEWADVWIRAAFRNSDLVAMIAHHGPVAGAEGFHRAHRVVANQLIVTETDSVDISDWARRTITVCQRLKRARDISWKHMAREIGATEAEELREAWKRMYPRAVWGDLA